MSPLTQQKHRMYTQHQRVYTQHQRMSSICKLKKYEASSGRHDCGFRIDFNYGFKKVRRYCHRNMSSAVDNPVMVESYLKEELSLGRVVGPLILELSRWVYTSPFGGHSEGSHSRKVAADRPLRVESTWTLWPAASIYHFYSSGRCPGVGCESLRCEYPQMILSQQGPQLQRSVKPT